MKKIVVTLFFLASLTSGVANADWREIGRVGDRMRINPDCEQRLHFVKILPSGSELSFDVALTNKHTERNSENASYYRFATLSSPDVRTIWGLNGLQDPFLPLTLSTKGLSGISYQLGTTVWQPSTGLGSSFYAYVRGETLVSGSGLGPMDYDTRIATISNGVSVQEKCS